MTATEIPTQSTPTGEIVALACKLMCLPMRSSKSDRMSFRWDNAGIASSCVEAIATLPPGAARRLHETLILAIIVCHVSYAQASYNFLIEVKELSAGRD